MKNLFQSRTIWLAVAQAVVSVLMVVFTEADMAGALLILKSVADIALRLDTNTVIK